MSSGIYDSTYFSLHSCEFYHMALDSIPHEVLTVLQPAKPNLEDALWGKLQVVLRSHCVTLRGVLVEVVQRRAPRCHFHTRGWASRWPSSFTFNVAPLGQFHVCLAWGLPHPWKSLHPMVLFAHHHLVMDRTSLMSIALRRDMCML